MYALSLFINLMATDITDTVSKQYEYSVTSLLKTSNLFIGQMSFSHVKFPEQSTYKSLQSQFRMVFAMIVCTSFGIVP